MSCKIHPSAVVAQGAELDSEVEVGPFCVIGPNVRIGRGTKLHSHAVIEGHTTLGPENEIFPFASVGAVPQDLKFKNEPARLIIGARNKIRECVTIHIGTEKGGMETVLGDNNLLMSYSHIAHDCIVGNNNIFANCATLAGHVLIKNNTIIGGMAGVHQFCVVWDNAMISGGSMVAYDVPPYCMAQGDRAVLRGINVVGLRRAGLDSRDVQEIRRAYREIFGTMGRYQEKIDALPEELRSRPLVKRLIDAILTSKRGICHPGKEISDSQDL